MMEMLQGWLLGLTAAALAVSLLTAMLPKGETIRRIAGLAGGLILLLAVLGGGGAFAYIKFIRPKQASKASADPDDYDFADEEEYINEDEPEQEEETEDTK